MVDSARVSIVPTNVAQAIAGMQSAERQQRADGAAKAPKNERARQRISDELDIEVELIEIDQAVRALGGNGQEQTHEDRRESGLYDPKGAARTGHPTIDVNG